MKKIILLICTALAVLFTGCKQLAKNNTDNQKGNAGEQPNTGSVKTTLKITNQSSRHIVDVNYDGKNYAGIAIGTSSIKELSEEASSYIRFTIYSKGHDVDGITGYGKKYDIRTNELITIEKGKTKLVTITDNTLVVVSGTETPVSLATLYEKPVTVSIKNKTSRMITDVTFNEIIFAQEKGEFNKGAIVSKNFTEECNGYVYFTIHERDHYASNEQEGTIHGDNYRCFAYKVRTLTEFSIKKYEEKTIEISDTTQVVKIGETEDNAVAISSLLKNDTFLKIENATTYNLIEIKYGYHSFYTHHARDEYNNIYDYLPINDYAVCKLQDETQSEYIIFETRRHKVRTAEKITVKKGSAKEVRITDNTMVVKTGSNEVVMLSSL